jgi:hypothetical protein
MEPQGRIIASGNQKRIPPAHEPTQPEHDLENTKNVNELKITIQTHQLLGDTSNPAFITRISTPIAPDVCPHEFIQGHNL